MNHVEYAEQPSLFELNSLPNGKVRIDLRECITSVSRETDDGIQTVWAADEYSIVQQRRANLSRDIEMNFAEYLKEAKAKEKAVKAAVELAAFTREMQNSIPDTLLDIDFRLMMLEELGNI